VAAPFDLNLLPFYRIKGQEWPQIPGLRIIAPQKRAARGREDDQLIVHLTLAGNTPFSSADYDKLITGLTERFHRSPGAVTSALRAGADSINQTLVERNMRTTSKGQYVIGRLILAVLRGPQVFLALCGPTHVFYRSGSGFRHIHEEQSAKSGLGVSQITPIHFSQADLHPGDMLALCAALPPGWEEALKEERGSFETLRRGLLSVSSEDLNAVLVQVKAGNGNLTILHGAMSAGKAQAVPTPPGGSDQKPEPSRQIIPTPPPTLPASRPVSQVSSGQPASRFAKLLAGQANEPPQEEGVPQPAQPETQAQTEPQAQAEPQVQTEPLAQTEPQDQTKPEVQPRPGARPARLITRPATTKTQAQTSRPVKFVGPRNVEKETPEIVRPSTQKRQQMFRGLAKWLRGMQVFSRNTSEKIRAFLPNLLPNLRDGEPRMTGMSMAFIAIVIPLLVVMAAMTFYNKHGKSASYQENYDQAWAASVWASEQTDPANIRVGWERTLYYLNTADDFQDTEELRDLRQRAQLALDNLDGILRLSFSPAIVGGLSQTVEVSHMAATNTDLYLLDAARGSVLRFYLGSQGYQADTQFSCAPGVYNDDIRVGELIDIVAAPKVNTFNATLIAMDGSGTLLLCRPSPAEPTAIQLATPSLGWRGVSGFTMDISSGYLYVLDPAGNAIWYYAPDTLGKYTTLPVMFFGAQVPADMASAMDLVTNGADLYLLFTDGHVTACTLLEFQGVPKRCSDPVQFADNRPDRTAGVTITDAYFTQMTFAEAPDQALYMFDPTAQAVYRFSPRTDSLILQGQFRASEEDRAKMLGSEASAMTISPNRFIFISVNGQVYYAVDVP
jgi:hypothetical protein